MKLTIYLPPKTEWRSEAHPSLHQTQYLTILLCVLQVQHWKMAWNGSAENQHCWYKRKAWKTLRLKIFSTKL